MKKGRAIGRSLKYAWIDFGGAEDAQSFGAAIEAMGWENLMTSLPRTVENSRVRYVDSAHPLLPIRREGSAVMIGPNAFRERDHSLGSEPLFVRHAGAAGEDALKVELKKHSEFLSRWVFSPGVKIESETAGSLTVDPSEATDFANLVVTSGHGSSGDVWGGSVDYGLHLTKALTREQPPPGLNSAQPDYILVPACMNLGKYIAKDWTNAFARPKPLRGVLGYGEAFPGGKPGIALLRNFTDNLRKDGFQMPILKAWAEAHRGTFWERWGLVMHEGAVEDTMKSWRTGELAPLSPAGKLLYFSHRHYPEGRDLALLEEKFFMGWHYKSGDDYRLIFYGNNREFDAGLFPGEPGAIKLYPMAEHKFQPGIPYSLLFYFWREQKKGMNLDRLLQFDHQAIADQGIKMEIRKDLNRRDATQYADGITFTVASETEAVDFPYVVHPQAIDYYGTLERPAPDSYGRFWMELYAGGEPPFDPQHAIAESYRNWAMLRRRGS